MPVEQTTTTLVDSNDVDFGTPSNPITSGQGPASNPDNGWPVKITDGVDIVSVENSTNAANGQQGAVVYAGDIVPVQEDRPSTCTVTSVLVNTVTTQLLAANPNRKGALFFNSGVQPVFLRLGAGASLLLFSVRIASNGLYEVDFPTYTGVITAISGAVSNIVLVTECI